MSRHRERQISAAVACPTCGAPRGQPCAITAGRPRVHDARRDAWRAARPADALEGADIVMTNPTRPDGRADTETVLLAPLTDRGRAAVPTIERVPATHIRSRLAALRRHAMIVMREDA